MIRIDEIWLATEPLDMRAGVDTALARVVQVFGSARPHCAYLFANKRGNRMKVLIHDGLESIGSVLTVPALRSRWDHRTVTL